MADLGRAALVVSLGLALYALVAGTAAATANRRRLADSARNALLACFGSTAVAAADLLAQRLLGRPGGIAAPLAARAERLRCPRRRPESPPASRPRRVGRAGDRRDRDVLR